MSRSLAIVFTLALTPAFGKITWTPSDQVERKRRLAFNLAQSVNDTSDASCIVGGYEDSNPGRVYVGGPCSELSDTTGPSANFRWVEMETVHLTIENTQGEEAPMKSNNPSGWPVINSQQQSTHVEVGLCGLFNFKASDIAHAGFFASTTSYLAQADISYNSNDFVIGKDSNGNYNKMGVCVQSCCASVGDSGCDCSGNTCRSENLQAVPGDFKYSILAAAYNTEASTTKGWAKAVENYGTGSPKALAGYTMVYQTIDFSHMATGSQATVTVTAPDGTSATYANMMACNVTNMTGCQAKMVYSMTVVAQGWEGVTYAFPQYFNRGTWTTSNDVTTSTPGDSKKVVIQAIKFDAASLQDILGLSASDAAAAKVLLVIYKFDITGITADSNTGKYFVYDPTVNTVSQAQAKAAASGSSSSGSGNSSSNGTGTATTGTTSSARTSTGLTMLAAVVAVFNFLK